MSLCCCGNLKLRLSRSKSSSNNKKLSCDNNGIVEEKLNSSDEKIIENNCPSIPPHAIPEQDSFDLSINEEPKVVLRSEPVRQKEKSSPETNENNNGVNKLNESRNSSFLKSVFHKSIRFDEENMDYNTNIAVKRQNSRFQKPFVATSRRGSLYIFRNADDVIITPFAQILASLRKVRANFMLITNIGSTNGKESKIDSDNNSQSVDNCPVNVKDVTVSQERVAQETLNELEWCLNRLENIQTHRSVSDMASTKFKQIINRELSQFADSSKSGHQISDYICKTFLDSQLDDSIPEASSFEHDIDENRNQIKQESMRRSARLIKANTEPVLNNACLNTDTLLNASIETPEIEEESESTEIDLPYHGVHVPSEEEVSKCLDDDLKKWGMNLFSFAEITGDQPLTVVSYTIFKELNLINKFQIDAKILVQFLMKAERSYRSTVPYHNNMHAADVTQSANVLLAGPALENVFSDLEILSVIFASIIHDMDHPGVTNQYLVNTNSELATMYNDNSVLENHHLAMAFSLLAKEECDFLVILSKRNRQSMRRMVIDMVLATDMSKHMTLLADLKTMVETKKVAGSGILTLDTYTDRIQILQNLVHCADLSNPTKPLHIYQKWIDRVMEEFYLQGDKERENDLEISPMCDRQTASLEKSQVSFIDFIVHPLWETWSELVYPDTQGMLEALEENRQFYFNKSQEKSKSIFE